MEAAKKSSQDVAKDKSVRFGEKEERHLANFMGPTSMSWLSTTWKGSNECLGKYSHVLLLSS
jgi:hypothetical protein